MRLFTLIATRRERLEARVATAEEAAGNLRVGIAGNKLFVCALCSAHLLARQSNSKRARARALMQP